MFSSSWVCVGHLGNLKDPGTYTAGAYMGMPYVLARSPDGQLRAFHNVCSPDRAQYCSAIIFEFEFQSSLCPLLPAVICRRCHEILACDRWNNFDRSADTMQQQWPQGMDPRIASHAPIMAGHTVCFTAPNIAMLPKSLRMPT